MNRQLEPTRSPDHDPTTERTPASTTDADRATLADTSAALVNLQFKREPSTGDLDDETQHAVAQEGVRGDAEELPHRDAIQRSFGPDHDLSGVEAHTGPEAEEASDALGAHGYAAGNKVAFGSKPDLHTSAHEAAHVVQQRSGVMRKAEVGATGDAHEQEADAVADRVVAGQSAAPLLAKYGTTSATDAGATGLQKRDRNEGKGPHPKPPEVIPDSEANEAVVEDAEHAAGGFDSATTLAESLYDVIIKQANAKAVHEQAVEAYDAAKKARDEATRKSELEKAWEAITSLVAFGTGVYGVFMAAKTVYTSARGLHAAYKTYKETKGEWIYGVGDVSGEQIGKMGGHAKKGGKAAWETGTKGKDTYDKGTKVFGGGGSAIDPDTILPDTNAAAIEAGNDALDQLMEAQIQFNMTVVSSEASSAARYAAHAARSIDLLTRSNRVFSEEMMTRIEEALNKAEEAHRQYQDALLKIRQAWKAYMAGGAEALQDEKERSLFETVAGWKRSGDKKADALHVAMDQKYKTIRFKGRGSEREETDLWSRTTSYHQYEVEDRQHDEGTLFIDDPAVAKELEDAGLVRRSGDHFWSQEGLAETAMEQDINIDRKYELSISMCKALISLGLHNWYLDCTVDFSDGGSISHKIQSRHAGDWYENWKDHPNFTEFWKTKLGGSYGYIKGDGDMETFAGADDEARARSVMTIPYR